MKSSTDSNKDKITRIAIGVTGANQTELNNFASVKRHKMEIDKEAIEKAIDSMKYFSSACEIACKDEYITWEDDYKAWKENQALLKKYIPTTIKPFPQTIKVPP